MRSVTEVVGRYYEAFGGKDIEKLRQILAPDFTFRGPMMRFDNPEAFVGAMEKFSFDATIESSRFIADGSRVAHAFLWKMTAPAEAEIPMCEVFEVSDGKIRSSELFYDARLFPSGGEERG